MAILTRDYVIRELAQFFLDELKRDRAGTEDWVAQGEVSWEEFIVAVRQLSSPQESEQ